jgi:hypothetical protein
MAMSAAASLGKFPVVLSPIRASGYTRHHLLDDGFRLLKVQIPFRHEPNVDGELLE